MFLNESKILLESYQKSKLNKNFKQKSIHDIKFKRIDIHNSEAKNYFNQDTCLIKNEKNYNGEIIIDTKLNKIIGRFLIGTGNDDKFISFLKVFNEYKGYGFGSVLIKDAIYKYKGIDLIVYKDNLVAIKLYKDNGFVVIKDLKDSYYMKLKNKLNEEEKKSIINI